MANATRIPSPVKPAAELRAKRPGDLAAGVPPPPPPAAPPPPPAANGRQLPDAERAAKALAAPFPANDVRCRPGAVKGNRAMVLPYVTARAVQDRLDQVLGIDGWQDQYRL